MYHIVSLPKERETQCGPQSRNKEWFTFFALLIPHVLPQRVSLSDRSQFIRLNHFRLKLLYANKHTTAVWDRLEKSKTFHSLQHFRCLNTQNVSGKENQKQLTFCSMTENIFFLSFTSWRGTSFKLFLKPQPCETVDEDRKVYCLSHSFLLHLWCYFWFVGFSMIISSEWK